jgi:hypothetical protein
MTPPLFNLYTYWMQPGDKAWRWAKLGLDPNAFAIVPDGNGGFMLTVLWNNLPTALFQVVLYADGSAMTIISPGAATITLSAMPGVNGTIEAPYGGTVPVVYLSGGIQPTDLITNAPPGTVTFGVGPLPAGTPASTVHVINGRFSA